MPRLMVVATVIVTAIAFVWPGTAWAAAPVVLGHVVDEAGNGVPDVFVIACDEATGFPVRKVKPDGSNKEEKPLDNSSIVFNRTDAAGQFYFAELHAGKYRLVAQSWPGSTKTDPFELHGVEVTLNGVAAGVEVPSDAALKIVIKPLGRGVLVLDGDAGNDGSIAVVSTKLWSADPALGLLGWFGPFAQSAIGFSRMPGGSVIFRGVPESGVAWTAIATDNNPGFAAGAPRLNRAGMGVDRVRYVASWSDGVHDPPKRLEALTKEMAAVGDKPNVWEIIGRPELAKPLKGWSGLYQQYEALGPLDRMVKLPSGTEAQVRDILAAKTYADLQKYEAERAKRVEADRARRQSKPAQP